MPNKMIPFDASGYLTVDETIAESLAVAQEDANPDMTLVAMQDVARARDKLPSCAS